MLEQIEYAQSETKASATMTIWRGINGVMGVFFVLAAYVQVRICADYPEKTSIAANYLTL